VEKGPPVLRLYGFSPPTLSIGRFQRTERAFDFERLKRDGIGFVRRPTGGQAVLHDEEVTYSIALPRHLFVPFRKREVYRMVSDILIAGLRNLGISATFSPIRQGSPYNPDCFGTTGEYEIVSSSGKKIIGSAQSTSRTYCLQHGAIPLEGSQTTLRRYMLNEDEYSSHESTSIREESGRPVDKEEVIEAVLEAFQTRFSLFVSKLTETENRLSRELRKAKYATEAWNLRM
jgi:lipoate-protein ligase A